MIAYPTYDGKVYVVLCQDRRMEISLTPTEAREIGRAMIWAARLALEFRHKHQDSVVDFGQGVRDSDRRVH